MPKFKNGLNLIKFEILISKENLDDINYIMAFECDDYFIPSKPIQSNDCNYLPIDLIKRCKSKILTAWSFGLPLVGFSFCVKQVT